MFFFNAAATTEIYTLSLHDALPICDHAQEADDEGPVGAGERPDPSAGLGTDTRRRVRLVGHDVQEVHWVGHGPSLRTARGSPRWARI